MPEHNAVRHEKTDNLEKEAKACLDQYWQDIGASAVLDRLSRHDLQIMHDVPLELSLAPLETTKPNPLEDQQIKDRNIFMKGGHHWLPKKPKEAKFANDFILKKSLERASKSKNPSESLAARYSEIREIYEDVRSDNAAFSRVGVVSRDINTPNIEALRTDIPALFAMGDRLFARECLDNGKWPTKQDYEKRRNHWHGFMIAAGQFASDGPLAAAFVVSRREVSKTYESDPDGRLEFWRLRVQSLNKTLGGVLIKDAVPIERVGEDSPKSDGIKGPSVSEIDFESILPREFQERTVQRRKEFAELREHLDHAGMPEAEKLAMLDRRFPEFTSVERSDYLDVRKDAIARGKLPPSPTPHSNAANKPGIRRLTGYDNEDDPSNPWHF